MAFWSLQRYAASSMYLSSSPCIGQSLDWLEDHLVKLLFVYPSQRHGLNALLYFPRARLIHAHHLLSLGYLHNAIVSVVVPDFLCLSARELGPLARSTIQGRRPGDNHWYEKTHLTYRLWGSSNLALSARLIGRVGQLLQEPVHHLQHGHSLTQLP